MHGKVLVANPNVVTQRMDDGAVLMDMASGECFELNRIGAEVWGRLGDGESPSELIEHLAASYGVPTSVVQSDVDQLLDRLTRSGLLTSTSTSTPTNP